MSEQHQQQQQTKMCGAEGCTFFGGESGFCSVHLKARLSKDSQQQPQQQPQAKEVAPTASPAVEAATPVVAPVETPAEAPKQKDITRCASCNKKVGLLGFKCHCSLVLCSSHRFEDQHTCSFDFRKAAQEKLTAANPKVEAAKLNKI